MNHESGIIKSFVNLDAWKEGHKLVVIIYSTSRAFPKEETFGLTSQIRRSAVSITSNIAEGFSQKSYREKMQFYQIALGSVMELQSQLLIARDINYLNKASFDSPANQSIKVHKILNGPIKSSRTLIPDS